MTGTHKIRDLISQVLSYDPQTSTIDSAVGYLCGQLFDEEAAHWRHANKKPADSEVPFNEVQILKEKWDEETGWIIPRIPELVSGVWYEHDINIDRATGPAAFMEGDVQVEWFSRANGEEELPIKIGEIKWANCRRYRKYEPLDEAISGFGFF